jgi:ABC-type transport system substrate-binding protein
MSSDAKTFTFTLRRDFRFSDGKPVRADAFARAINRTLAPQMGSVSTTSGFLPETSDSDASSTLTSVLLRRS